MKFAVFQINFTDAQYNEINGAGERPDFYNKYLDTTFRPTAKAVTAARDLYKLVAEIEADNLDQVFDIGNIGPEHRITRFDRMHSLSVGDVVVNEAGEAKFIAPIGFEPVDFFQVETV